jgi:hypothetical protein
VDSVSRGKAAETDQPPRELEKVIVGLSGF